MEINLAIRFTPPDYTLLFILQDFVLRVVILLSKRTKFRKNDGFELRKIFATNSPPVGGVAIAGVGISGILIHEYLSFFKQINLLIQLD